MLKSIPMTTQALLGMVIGYLFGLLAGPAIVPYMSPIGQIFINLLFMIAVPFIFFSIVTGVASMSDLKKTGRIGAKIGLYYAATTVIAAITGVCLAYLIAPGVGFSEIISQGNVVPPIKSIPSISETVVGLFPRNVFASLSNMNLIQVICFSLFLGAGLVMLGERKKPVLDVFDTLCTALIKVIEIIMKTVPIGVFALMAETGAKYGFDAISSVAKVILTEYAAMGSQFFIVFGLILLLGARVNPFVFYKRCIDIMMTTASTCSSGATLPVTMRTAIEKIGVPRDIAGFTLPLGATMNMNGGCLNIAICTVFSAQVYGYHLSLPEIATLVTIASLSAVGAAAVPGSGMMFILAMLTQFNIPTEAFALVIAVYRINDMGLTTINTMGDIVCTTAVAQSERVLDRSLWDVKPLPA